MVVRRKKKSFTWRFFSTFWASNRMRRISRIWYAVTTRSLSLTSREASETMELRLRDTYSNTKYSFPL